MSVMMSILGDRELELGSGSGLRLRSELGFS